MACLASESYYFQSSQENLNFKTRPSSFTDGNLLIDPVVAIGSDRNAPTTGCEDISGMLHSNIWGKLQEPTPYKLEMAFKYCALDGSYNLSSLA